MKPEQFYSKTKNKMMKQKIKPGVYAVIETDWAGEQDIPQFNVKITKPMNYYEAAIQIANKTNYLSLWEYIVLKPTTEKAKITIPEFLKENNMFIVYKKPTIKNYIIVKVAKETDKTYIIDQYGDSNFISIEASVKKEHVVWITENYGAATQIRNTIMIAHKNQQDMIKLAEDGYKNHIINIMKIVTT